MLCDKLYYRSAYFPPQAHFKMDALEETPSNWEVFGENNLVYLHCCTFDHPAKVRIPGLTLLSLNVRYCHFSFPKYLRERRVCLIPNSERLLHQLKDVKSPCVIEVLSSTVLKETNKDMLLVWDFRISSLTASAAAIAPRIPEVDLYLQCPFVDLKNTSCNCSKFPHVGSVLLEEYMLEIKQEEVNEGYDDESQPQEKETETELFTEVYKLKGSSYHEDFQQALRICKFKLINNNFPHLRCHLEPTNAQDVNAVVVQVLLDDKWCPIGYVPAKKVQKVNIAIMKGELRDTALVNVVYQYIHDLERHKYFPIVKLTKNRRWPHDNSDYVYNDPIPWH